jgi:hypothetical protein
MIRESSKESELQGFGIISRVDPSLSRNKGIQRLDNSAFALQHPEIAFVFFGSDSTD